jgi:hypothetical protein
VCQFCVTHRLEPVPSFHDSSNSITQRWDERRVVLLGGLDGITKSSSYVVDTCPGTQQIDSESISESVGIRVGNTRTSA